MYCLSFSEISLQEQSHPSYSSVPHLQKIQSSEGDWFVKVKKKNKINKKTIGCWWWGFCIAPEYRGENTQQFLLKVTVKGQQDKRKDQRPRGKHCFSPAPHGLCPSTRGSGGHQGLYNTQCIKFLKNNYPPTLLYFSQVSCTERFRAVVLAKAVWKPVW